MATVPSQPGPAWGPGVWRRVFGQLADRGKLRGMALWGAVGCLAGALCAELPWLLAPRPVVPQKQICLLLDCSGSMFQPSGRERSLTKLEEVKIAANHFVTRQNFEHERLAVVGFGDGAHLGAPLSDDKKRLQLAIDLLSDGGGTNMAEGLLRAASELPNAPGAAASNESEKNILLFTDGQPENKFAALAAARACRERKIRIVAIGAGDADIRYLAEVTGDPQLVFPASAGNFGESFQQAEKAMHGGSLVESGASEQGFWTSLALLVAWTALLAVGISLALIAGQNLYLHRPLMSRSEITIGALGGLGAGAAAGLIGQGVYSVATALAGVPGIAAVAPLLIFVGRVVGWLILGALVGRGLAFFIPNLAPRNAWIGGAIGGLMGSVAFVLVSLVGDAIGRLVGAAILGAMIGMMLALAEAASRRAWLEVYFGKNESVRINLGPTLVKVGSDSRACVVYARGARPLAMGYRFAEGRVECIDYATEQSKTVVAGDKREIGAVTVVVCISAREGAPAASPGSPGAGKGSVPPLPKPPPSRSPSPSAIQQPTAPAPPTSAASKPPILAANGGGRGAADSPLPATKAPAPLRPLPGPTAGGATTGSPAPTANRTIRPIPPPAPPPKPGP